MYFRRMNEALLEKLRAQLANPGKIGIVTHKSPDGDAMGSSLGLYHLLKQFGHKIEVFTPNRYPEFLAWMPESERIVVFDEQNSAATALLNSCDTIFTLDFNAFHRAGDMEHALKNKSAFYVMVDHHQMPDTYAQITFSDTAYASTCEMIYDLAVGLGCQDYLNKDVAACLYTGIVTDTGSFRFAATKPSTHLAVAHLMQTGIDHAKIYSNIHDNFSADRLQLMGRSLQNLKVFPEKKTAYTKLSQAELDAFNYVKGDTEGLVNLALSIKGIVFAAIFIEHTDEKIIKISFRSQGDFDVNQFAIAHFNGGGHINAAGGKSNVSLAETIQKFEELVLNLDI